MPFEQGNTAGPGRPKGSKNKATIAVQTMIADQYPDWNPVLAMAEIAQNADLELPMRVQCMKEVAGYMYPKQKAVQLELDAPQETVKITWGKAHVDEATPD